MTQTEFFVARYIAPGRPDLLPANIPSAFAARACTSKNVKSAS
jgi:hypothetical protein